MQTYNKLVADFYYILISRTYLILNIFFFTYIVVIKIIGVYIVGYHLN